MADQKLLTLTLPEFASTLVRDVTISDVLHDLAERAAAVRPGDVVTVELYLSKFESDVGRIDTIALADGTILRNTPRTDHGDVSRY